MSHTEMTSEQCQYAVLDSILLLNRSRIHNRLRGKRSPTLLQDSLSNLLKSLTADSQAGKNSVVLSRLQTLYDVVACYHARIEKLRGLEDVKKLVVGCHDFFKATPEGDDMKTLLRRADIDVDASRGDSCLRQIGKIANYYHVAESFSMIASNQEYRQFCINLSVRYLTPYKMVQSPIPAVDKCGRDCRVHAEVQLVVDIDLNLSLKWRKPRTIGSSKAPCFLCELFIGKHGEYFVPRTHGKLTPRWTIPNLDQFTKRQVSRYRNIIGAMMREFQSLAKIPHPRRLETAMSWQSLSQLTLAWYLKPSAMHRSSRRHLEQAVQTLERRSKESATTKSSSIRSEDANSVLTTIREEGIRCHAFEPYSDTKISEQKRSTGDPECDGPWRTNPGNTSYCSSPGPSTLNLKHGISNSFPSINTTHLGLQSKTSRSSGGRKRVARSLTNLDSKVPLSPLAAAIKSYRTTTGALNRTIEFRDLELFLETGPVAGVQTIVIPSPNPPSNSKDRVIVEVDKLTPGTSLDVDTDEDLNAPRMMFLTLRDGDGVERWWECHWKAVAQVR